MRWPTLECARADLAASIAVIRALPSPATLSRAVSSRESACCASPVE